MNKYFIPAEWDKHKGTIIMWPYKTETWHSGARNAQKVFIEVIKTIAKYEKVYLCTPPEYTKDIPPFTEDVEILEIPYDDAWARDIAPSIAVMNNELIGLNWTFNAWGGLVDGLYSPWDKDSAFKRLLALKLHLHSIDFPDFILEGGSISLDGEGTCMVTEACLLSRGRNSHLSKEQIELKLKEYLNVEKILWLPHGIYNDETNEHVDNVACFVRGGEILLAMPSDTTDIQYEYSMKNLLYLKNEKDALGRELLIHFMPMPKPLYLPKDVAMNLIVTNTAMERASGDRLAASYINFYIGNGFVLYPMFADASDELAKEVLVKLFPNRDIIGINTLEILYGGGNIHCITQQIPEVHNEKN